MHSHTITVFGAGYAGLPLAVLMALGQCVRLLGIDAPKIDLIRHGIGHGLPENPLHATINAATAHGGTDVVGITAPAEYDSEHGYFDTGSVEAVAAQAFQYCPQALLMV